jgi:hypothetical protein
MAVKGGQTHFTLKIYHKHPPKRGYNFLKRLFSDAKYTISRFSPQPAGILTLEDPKNPQFIKISRK